MSPGYEEVYELYLTITLDNNLHEEIVLARFIDGTDSQLTLDEACESVLKFVKINKDLNKVVLYKRLDTEFIFDNEKGKLDGLEKEIKKL